MKRLAGSEETRWEVFGGGSLLVEVVEMNSSFGLQVMLCCENLELNKETCWLRRELWKGIRWEVFACKSCCGELAISNSTRLCDAKVRDFNEETSWLRKGSFS